MTTTQETAARTPDEYCPTEAGTLDEEGARQVVAVTKVLSDPVRLRLYAHIAASRCSSVCACHLPEVFGVSQPTMSYHLKKLLDTGLIDREMRGRWAHYTVRPEGLASLREFLSTLPE